MKQMRNINTTNDNRRRAFTLLELIIVAAIIGLLLSLVLIAMGGVTDAGNRAASANALRNMIRAYQSYSQDYDQKLMPGYIHRDMIGTGPNQLDMFAKLSDGTELNAADSASYVWRMMPYLDEAYTTLLADYRAKGVDGRIDTEIGRGIYGPGTIDPTKDLGLALQPSFGLNSIYLGGDSFHGGPQCADRNPWFPSSSGKPLAALRISDVLNTARTIVFAPNRQASMDMEYSPAINRMHDVVFGYVELRPPMLIDRDGSVMHTYWTVDANATVPDSDNLPAGVPYARWSDNQIPTARLDGSVQSNAITDLGLTESTTDANVAREVMKYWWPFATGFR